MNMQLSGNIKKEVQEWIKEQRKEGKADSYLRQEMLKKGYSSEVIEELLKRKGIKLGKIPIYLLILLIIGLVLYFTIPLMLNAVSVFSAEICLDQECFISAANNCDNARIQQLEDGTLFEYSTKNCVLTKTLKTMSEEEPSEMQGFLEGTSMKCAYTAGNFNENWINYLTIDIEQCEGELKDSLTEIVYAV